MKITSMKTTKAIIVSLLLSMAFPAEAHANVDIPVTAASETGTSSLPVVSPYFLQHQYLSVVAPMIGETEGFLLESPETLNTLTPADSGFRSPFSDGQITVEKFVTDGKDIYVWRFPEPEYLREALYMVFVPVDGQYQAFAISIGETVDWEVSKSTETSRSTFGRIKKPESAEECVMLLKERGLMTGRITPGEFFQEGYAAPRYRK